MTVAVATRGLLKEFGPTVALGGVDISFHAGEIHAVVGENGSGKSTLFKILAGVYTPDAGEVVVRGDSVRLPIRPRDVDALGFAFVHQDLGIAESLPVLDNARVGLYEPGVGWRISWRQEREAFERQLAGLGLRVDPDAPAGSLGQAERTLVAIARALGHHRSGGGGTLLVLDEPSAYLSVPDREKVYAAMRAIAANGVAVVFSTHDMDEARELSDRITVMRDGNVSAVFAGSVGKRELVQALVGRDLDEYYPSEEQSATGEVVLSVRDVGDGFVEGVSFDLHRGEILGITGLVGAGQDRLPYLLSGFRPWRTGAVEIGGTTIAHLTPTSALRHGLALLPANRQQHSGLQRATLAENVTLPYLRRFKRRLRLDRKAEQKHVRDVLTRSGVRPRHDPSMQLRALSGGNQQKALLGKWLSTPRLEVLMLHEPTQGVDIGAKQDLFAQIQEAARAGLAVLLFTAEYGEMAHLADRVIVMRRGRPTEELHGSDVTEDRIVHSCHAAPTGA